MRLGSKTIRIDLSVRRQIPKWRVSLCLESPRISHNQGVQGSITKPIRSFLAGNYKTVLQQSEVHPNMYWGTRRKRRMGVQ